MARKPYNVGPVTYRSMPFWCVGNPVGDPFGGAILDRIDSLEVAKLVCWAAGQGLIESTGFHDDDLVPWNPEKPEDDLDKKGPVYKKLMTIKAMLDQAGVSVNTATCSLHGHPLFRNGGNTNPDPKIRELARLKVERTIRIGHLFGARYFTYWVARDGFEVGVKVNWPEVFDWLAGSLNHAAAYIKAKKFSNYLGCTIEPKPNEPRGHMFLPTAGHAVGFIYGKLKNPEFWGVNPELLQHESMALMNALNTLGFLVSTNKLSFLHFGSQIKAQFDNDFPPLVGPEGLKETVQMFWLLNQMGWKGVVEYDCHMLRAEADPANSLAARQQFIRNCATALSITLELAARLDGNWMTKLTDSQADHLGIMKMCGLSEAVIAKKITSQIASLSER